MLTRFLTCKVVVHCFSLLGVPRFAIETLGTMTSTYMSHTCECVVTDNGPKTSLGLMAVTATATVRRRRPRRWAMRPTRVALAFFVAVACVGPRATDSATTKAKAGSKKTKAATKAEERARKTAAKARARAERARRESGGTAARDPQLGSSTASYPTDWVSEGRNQTEVWEQALPPGMYQRVKDFTIAAAKREEGGTGERGGGEKEKKDVGEQYNYVPLSPEHVPRNAIEEAVGYLASTLVRPPVSPEWNEGRASWESWEGVEWRVRVVDPTGPPEPYRAVMDSYKLQVENEQLHPELSSILHLTDHGGPTTIFNQTIGTRGPSPRIPSQIQIIFPRENLFTCFVGDRYHGVVHPPAYSEEHQGHNRSEPATSLDEVEGGRKSGRRAGGKRGGDKAKQVAPFDDDGGLAAEAQSGPQVTLLINWWRHRPLDAVDDPELGAHDPEYEPLYSKSTGAHLLEVEEKREGLPEERAGEEKEEEGRAELLSASATIPCLSRYRDLCANETQNAVEVEVGVSFVQGGGQSEAGARVMAGAGLGGASLEGGSTMIDAATANALEPKPLHVYTQAELDAQAHAERDAWARMEMEAQQRWQVEREKEKEAKQQALRNNQGEQEKEDHQVRPVAVQVRTYSASFDDDIMSWLGQRLPTEPPEVPRSRHEKDAIKRERKQRQKEEKDARKVMERERARLEEMENQQWRLEEALREFKLKTEMQRETVTTAEGAAAAASAAAAIATEASSPANLTAARAIWVKGEHSFQELRYALASPIEAQMDPKLYYHWGSWSQPQGSSSRQ